MPVPDEEKKPTLEELLNNVDKESPDETPDEKPDEEEKPSKVFTQEELEKVLAKRLKRHEETLAKKYADYDSLKDKASKYDDNADKDLAESERWAKKISALEAAVAERDEKLNKVERSNLIAELATEDETKLPKKLWRYVQGDNAEDIEASIKEIINDFGLDKEPEGDEKPKKAAPKKNAVYGGGGENEDPDPDIDKLVSRIPRGPQIRIEKTRTR